MKDKSEKHAQSVVRIDLGSFSNLALKSIVLGVPNLTHQHCHVESESKNKDF